MNSVKKSIGWPDFTVNPVKGLCPVDCKDRQGKSYCYARAMYKRFKWNPEIRYMDYSLWDEVRGIRKPSRIFIGSTMELFGDWIKPAWSRDIFETIRDYPQHIFIFLTKQPQNLPKEFPLNCWVGASATDYYSMFKAVRWLPEVEASVKFISFEPLLESVAGIRLNLDGIDWVIIGQRTPVSKKTTPKLEWIQEIVEACDKANIPVFLKNNLNDFIYGEYGGKYKHIFKYAQDGGRELRQEFPK